MEYKCYNPECNHFEKVTMTYNLTIKNVTVKKCNYCLEPIDMDRQVLPNEAPYIKNKRWLNEWKFVNSGTHSDEIVQKPNLDLE
jgi:hypothetical protein